jgi:hypothetical protein
MSQPPQYNPDASFSDSDESDNEESIIEHQFETRTRRNALGNPQKDIFDQPPSLFRTVSIEAQSQTGEGTCFAHASARLITRLISRIIPRHFLINETQKELLRNPETKTKNCFVTSSSKNIEDLRNILSPINYTNDKCPINGKYNTLIIYYYTLLTIKRDYGCNGGFAYSVLSNFAYNPENFYNLKSEIKLETDGLLTGDKRGYLISKSVDDQCRVIIREYIGFINGQGIEIEADDVGFKLSDNIDDDNNWITNFPDEAKTALKNNMYVELGFNLARNQWKNVLGEQLTNFTPIPETDCILNEEGKTDGHCVVITNWEKDEETGICYVTIINSWGTKWGVSGLVRIPSTSYNKFVLSTTCEQYENSSMRFSFFNILNKRGNPFIFPTTQMGTKDRPRTLSQWKGGKTKKNIKRKHKKTKKYVKRKKYIKTKKTNRNKKQR